jgi:hypothetical protein
MTYHEHQSVGLPAGELKPEDRVVVGTRRKNTEEVQRFADAMGLSRKHPQSIVSHRVWDDGEYLPVFHTAQGIDRQDFLRFRDNYTNEDGERIWGHGLKGKTVYIVHTLDSEISPQELDKRVEFIADTAKYQGAEKVVLVAYTLTHSAQERGVHQLDHPRMQDFAARGKYDGQGIISQAQSKLYAAIGVDTVITPHNHCPGDTRKLIAEVNEHFEPMHRAAQEKNSTLRYKLDFVHVDLAPLVGTYLRQYGTSHLGFDLSNQGANVLMMDVDLGSYDGGFVERVKEFSGLENALRATMNKRKKGGKVETIELVHAPGLSEERGIEGLYIFAPDDVIRSGRTMSVNLQALRGMFSDKVIRDPRIQGTPARIAIYASRTNFTSSSVDVLGSPAIDDILIADGDPRALANMSGLNTKTQVLWVNSYMAEAAKAVERGKDPNEILTPDRILQSDLLDIMIPRSHERLGHKSRGTSDWI